MRRGVRACVQVRAERERAQQMLHQARQEAAALRGVAADAAAQIARGGGGGGGGGGGSGVRTAGAKGRGQHTHRHTTTTTTTTSRPKAAPCLPSPPPLDTSAGQGPRRVESVDVTAPKARSRFAGLG
jgi:hypothetical protein